MADLRKQGVAAQHFVDPGNSAHLLRVGPVRNYAEAKALRARFAGVYSAAIILP